MIKQTTFPVLLTIVLLTVAGCGSAPQKHSSTMPATASAPSSESSGESAASGTTAPGPDMSQDTLGRTSYIESGTGHFINPPSESQAKSGPGGDVTLNFEDTDIRQVVKIILGDTLGANYSIDPAVKGSATLQTSQPLHRDSLLPTLEMLLRMNGAAVVRQGSLYRVLPLDTALHEGGLPQLGDSAAPLPRGYGVQIVPLKFVAAAEMRKILEPLTRPENVVREDDDRNLLILAGSGPELGRMLDLIHVFDVDWLRGMSVALFVPEFVDAGTLADELSTIFDKGPLKGLVRIVSIDKANAVLAMSPRHTYLEQVSDWVQRLDRNTGGKGNQLFVYRVKNSKASDLANVLAEVFGTGGEAGLTAPQVAPGLEPAQIQSTAGPLDPPEDAGGDKTGPAAGASAVAQGHPPEDIVVPAGTNTRIIADDANNALVIMAPYQQYEQIRTALRELDVVPMQVLIEATIAEITLTGEFKFGLEWYFNHHADIGSPGKGRAMLNLGDMTDLAVQVPGFSYALTNAAGIVRGVLNTLAANSHLNVISSPSLMVLNNHTAKIQVGDEVPVTTQQQQATVSQSSLVNTIQFRDTGVQLSVTPRINPGGLVTMEITQEVSDVAPGSGRSLTPTIQQRRIESTVSVNSSQTVVLGGLIRENRTEQKSGIPILYDIPVLGPLFGRTSTDHQRTELVVLLTPRVVQGAEQAKQITREFQDKMQSLKSLYKEVDRSGSGASATESR